MSQSSQKDLKIPSIEEMITAGVHFGHQVRRKNPKMDKYIYSTENKTNIIDLYKTEEALQKAVGFLYEVAARGKQVVIVGTKRQAAAIVKTLADESGALFVNQRWLGGTFTNFESVKFNCNTLKSIESGFRNNEFTKYTKKERLLLERKAQKLTDLVGGIRDIEKFPGAIIVVDAKREKTAIKEAKALNVPVVAFVDTNSDPKGIDFAIPANDDAMKSIELVLGTLTSALKEGYKNKPVKAETPKIEKKVEAVKPVVAVEEKKKPVAEPKKVEKAKK